MRRFLAQTSRTVVVFLAGLVLVVAGLFGLALPILPGWVLVIAGVAVWSREFPWAMRLRQRVADHVRGATDRVRQRVREQTGEHPVTAPADHPPAADAGGSGSDTGDAGDDRQERTGIDVA